MDTNGDQNGMRFSRGPSTSASASHGGELADAQCYANGTIGQVLAARTAEAARK